MSMLAEQLQGKNEDPSKNKNEDEKTAPRAGEREKKKGRCVPRGWFRVE
jgi:hypothetical protein